MGIRCASDVGREVGEGVKCAVLLSSIYIKGILGENRMSSLGILGEVLHILGICGREADFVGGLAWVVC